MGKPSSLRNKIKIASILFFSLTLFKAIWVLALHVDSDQLALHREYSDLLRRRAYLVARMLETPKVEAMHGSLPSLFQGEWAVVTYSMLSTGLTNMAFIVPDTRGESLAIIDGLIQQMLTPEFRRFDSDQWGEDALETLDNDNGHIGYLGHLNFMLASYRFLGGHKYGDLFARISQSLKRKIIACAVLNAETYPNQIYIPDNAVVVASLALYDRLYPKDAFADRWVNKARRDLEDPATGLLVHRIDMKGTAIEYSRGCSTGWNSFYLPFISEAFAKEQYALLKKHLQKKTWLGLEGIREFPRGVLGWGDIDSGPVIFELSMSGTGMAVAGAKFHGDAKFFNSLLLTAEVVGSSWQWNGRRRYLFAPLVGDAIMLAARSATRWDTRFIEKLVAQENRASHIFKASHSN